MKEFWDDRYGKAEYAYGETANAFLSQALGDFETGKILFPAEGEGRNAVFAAAQGWSVQAFDLSDEGKKKAAKLAAKNGVQIDYQVGDFAELDYPADTFDALALIYAHFPAAVKSAYHQKLIPYLKTGGIVIFEAFSKNHLKYKSINPKVGGPAELDMLFSIEEIKNDFNAFDIIQLSEEEIELNEGDFHIGTGSVIRFIARKKV